MKTYLVVGFFPDRRNECLSTYVEADTAKEATLKALAEHQGLAVVDVVDKYQESCGPLFVCQDPAQYGKETRENH